MVWLGYAYYFAFQNPSWLRPGFYLAERGQFGDSFGALNALFTGLAFVGLVATFWHERERAAKSDRQLEKERADATRVATETEKKFADERETANRRATALETKFTELITSISLQNIQTHNAITFQAKANRLHRNKEQLINLEQGFERSSAEKEADKLGLKDHISRLEKELDEFSDAKRKP